MTVIGAPAPARGQGRLSVLIVDDQSFVREAVRHVVRALGITEIITAGSGTEALDLLEATPDRFDLILLDLQLPGVDGLALLRHLSLHPVRGAFVLMSGLEADLLQRALDLGTARGLTVLGALSKPVTQKALRPIIERLSLALGLVADPASLPAPTAADLAEGLAQDAIGPVYQPLVRLTDRRVVAFEALARWNGGARGTVLPEVFIPLAEQAGLIDALTDAMLRQALADLKRWRGAAFDVGVGLNLSPRSLGRVDFPDQFEALASREAVPLDRLSIEVTETGIAEATIAALDLATRLRLKRVSLAIDDFGTGFTSLRQLQQFPFNEIKIDRLFVHQVWRSERSVALLDTHVRLCRSLGLTVVAEGVEDLQDWHLLERLQVDLAQGYVVARPMPAEEVLPWLRAWTAP